jgi:MFS family permease
VHYRWLVVIFTMLMQAVSYGILVYSFALFVMPWSAAFDAERTSVMMTVFVLQIGMGVISPFAGRMLDLYPSRWLVTSGGLLLAACLLLVSVATSLWQITLIYALLLPIAITLTGPIAAQTIITKWFAQKRGLAIGVSAVGTSVGGFLVPILTSALLVGMEWRSVLQYLAVLALFLVCPLAWLILRRTAPAETIAEAGNSAPDASAAAPLPVEVQKNWTTREILSTRNFWLPVLAMLPLNMAFSGVQFNLAAYAQDLGNSVAQAAWLISLMSLAMISGKLFFGFMADRVEHRKLFWLAAGFMCLNLILLQGGPSYFVLALCSLSMGLAVGGMLPLIGMIYGQRFGVRSFGRVVGLVTMILTIGGFGPLIAGAVFDATGNYDAAFMLFLVLLIPGALGLLGLKKH